MNNFLSNKYFICDYYAKHCLVSEDIGGRHDFNLRKWENISVLNSSGDESEWHFKKITLY